MEIAGFFDGVGRPRVEARVGFTGLNLGGEIRFVVDTGADRTLIGTMMPYDSGWTTDTTGRRTAFATWE